MSDARAEEGSAVAGAPTGSWFSRRLSRAWGTRRGRRGIVFVVGLLLVAVIVGLGASMISSLSGETQSYRDGYSVGGSAYGSYSSESATQACRTMELGSLPSGDSSSQWLKGCMASFDASQADN